MVFRSHAPARRSSPSPRLPDDPTELDLRALRALRRVGSRGLLQQFLFPRMRPARSSAMRAALEQLEQRGLIAKAQEARGPNRVQTVWRITAEGRAIADAHDLPPAA